ncbi:MAG: hypothetical protein ACI4UV_08705 [Victivallales bacterium]
MKRIYFNEDNEHFYDKPVSEMTRDGLRRLVSRYTRSGCIKGIMFCANVQTALFESNVWQRFRDLPDSAGPAKKGLTALAERGINHLQVWLDECRNRGVEGWLTMRMNDCHGLEETAAKDFRIPMSFWASDFWIANPHLRRAPYRRERAWEGAFDYGCEEVRKHHLALIKELLARFDMDGLELDWMRWVTMFKPGYERINAGLLTDFISRVREYVDAAERKWGHPIRLGHRIPADPMKCFDFGFDIPKWAENNAVDMLTLGFFGMSSGMDYPLEIWRKLLPEKTLVNTQAGPGVTEYPGTRAYGYEFLFGSADAAFSRGADAVYLFNICYLENQEFPLLEKILKTLGSPEQLTGSIRRFAVDYHDSFAAGTPVPAVLPQELKFTEQYFGRFRETITLRLSAGNITLQDRCILRLGFAGLSDSCSLNEMPVWFNTRRLAEIPGTDFPVISGRRVTPPPGVPQIVEHLRCYAVPAGECHADFNAVEILPPQINGHLVWAELVIIPKGK